MGRLAAIEQRFLSPARDGRKEGGEESLLQRLCEEGDLIGKQGQPLQLSVKSATIVADRRIGEADPACNLDLAWPARVEVDVPEYPPEPLRPEGMAADQSGEPCEKLRGQLGGAPLSFELRQYRFRCHLDRGQVSLPVVADSSFPLLTTSRLIERQQDWIVEGEFLKRQSAEDPQLGRRIDRQEDLLEQVGQFATGDDDLPPRVKLTLRRGSRGNARRTRDVDATRIVPDTAPSNN